MKDKNIKKRKSIKINEDLHKILSDYCILNDLKINKFIERLIMNNCKNK